jgi:hypothetical protein
LNRCIGVRRGQELTVLTEVANFGLTERVRPGRGKRANQVSGGRGRVVRIVSGAEALAVEESKEVVNRGDAV